MTTIKDIGISLQMSENETVKKSCRFVDEKVPRRIFGWIFVIFVKLVLRDWESSYKTLAVGGYLDQVLHVYGRKRLYLLSL